MTPLLYRLEDGQIENTDRSHGCRWTLTPDPMNLFKGEELAGHRLDQNMSREGLC